MNIVNFFRSCFGTGSFFTKENAVILTGIIAEISVLATMIFYQIHLAFLASTIISFDLVGAFLMKKSFSFKKETHFDYFQKLQDKEQELVKLRNEVEELKKPKID